MVALMRCGRSALPVIAQVYVLFGLCCRVQLGTCRVVARCAREEELMTADALRWYVLLRKSTIVERLDCERLPANRADVRRRSVYARTRLTVRGSAEIKPIALLTLHRHLYVNYRKEHFGTHLFAAREAVYPPFENWQAETPVRGSLRISRDKRPSSCC